MLRRNFLREKLESGETVIGTWSVIPSPILSDVICSSGIDFFIVDFEHGPTSFETAQQIVITCESRFVSPVMRIGGVIPAEILRALEIGVHCLQVPNIENISQVNDLIKFCQYPPVGNKGFSPFTRAGGYSHDNSSALKNVKSSVLFAIHIEGKEAVDNIDQILSVNEIDIIFIGKYDLSKSLGIPGLVDDPRVDELVRYLVEKIVDAGKYPGTIATNKDQLQSAVNLGVRYITFSVDCEVVLAGYKSAVNDFNLLKQSV